MTVDKPGVRGIRSVQGMPDVLEISLQYRKAVGKIINPLHSRSEVYFDVPASNPPIRRAKLEHGTLSRGKPRIRNEVTVLDLRI